MHEKLEKLGHICKPNYFTAVDPNKYTKIGSIVDELADWFAKSQLDQWNMWQRNKADRAKEAASRREAYRLGVMEKEEEPFKYSRDGYSISRVFTKRDSILNIIVNTPRLARLIGEHTDNIVPSLVRKFSTTLNIRRNILEQTIYSLFSGLKISYPSLADLRRLCWIIAANLMKLQVGTVVEPFTKPKGIEWAPSVVVGYENNDKVSKNSGIFEFLLLGGAGATFSFKHAVSFTKGGYAFLNGHMFKLRRKFKKLKMRGRFEYIGMHTWLLLEPKSRIFDSAACCDIFKTMNRKVYDGRIAECPIHLANPCRECPLGLDTCDKATHRLTYVEGVCDVCGNQAAWFIDRFDDCCINCKKKETRK